MSLTLLPVNADITFKFGGGIYNTSLKAKMEHNISVLLTEIHKAGQSNRSLNLSEVSMEQTAKTALMHYGKCFLSYAKIKKMYQNV